MRLIDADKLKETMMKYYGCENATKYGNETAEQQAHSYSTLMLYEVADMIEDCIDIAPTVEERPTGKWVFDGFCVTSTKFKCSACLIPELEKTNYCPNCGARMKGGAEE
jgi:hypothetical protein